MDGLLDEIVSRIFIQETVVLLDKTMTEHFRREEERAGKRAGGEEDYDEGVEEQLEDEDDEDVYILSKVGDVIHAMFVTHGEGFLPAFERLLPLFSRLLEPTRPWSDLQWGLCIFDDLIEYTGELSFHYYLAASKYLVNRKISNPTIFLLIVF